MPQPDDKFDWVQLTSGEWLKGELKFLYDYQVEFDSEKLALLTLAGLLITTSEEIL